MATGGQEKGNVPDYVECPVCRDCLTDARTLNCAHYFCRRCIEGLVREKPKRPIQCPTCRELTYVPKGSEVTDLPPHEGKYSFNDQVTNFLSQAKGQITRSCNICRVEKVTATCHCFRCRTNLCADCLKKHDQRAPTHKTVPMAESIFCPSHVGEVVVEHCKECKRDICGHCLFEGHENHQTVDIELLAKEGRLRLQDFLKIESARDVDERTLKGIQSQLEDARKLETEFNDSMSKAQQLIKELETKLNQVERDTKAKFAAGIKTLSLYETNIKDMMTSRKILVDHATYLVDKASDQELAQQEKQFPMNKCNVLQNISDARIELPVLNKTFLNVATQLQQMVVDCEVNFLNKNIGTVCNIEDMKKQHSVVVEHTIGGITMDTSRLKLIVRTTHVSGPLKVYDYQGQLQESLGAGVKGLADCGDSWRSICMDTKRHYYLAPWQRELLVVNGAGQLVKSIPVGGIYNCGVAYHKKGDSYLVSSYDTNAVYLINANTSHVTRQIGSGGSGPTQFSYPCDVHVGTVADIGAPCIIISDRENDSLKLLDFTGRHVKTYGSSGTGDGQLSKPVDVTTDQRGRIIVCDRGNNRVTAFSTDGGEDQYTCLLHDDWGGQPPWRLALDTENMVLVVVDYNGRTLYTYK